jgi:outer membrane receptor protein involved in Fe transport
MRTLLLLTLFITTVFGAAAQKGQLAGKVTDAKNAEELMGATIVIDGTITATVTDFSGDYILPNINPGTYTIRCQLISYEPALTAQVVIKSGETTKLDIKMKPVELDLQEVKVVAKANRSNETMLLLEQKNAVVATQSVGAQELTRKGAGDAEAAVTKVSGISKQEGVKNVFVRGLGDRYNATSLNGFPVPSEDPEYKNISLDFFGSDMIQSVGVNKVFSANATGDVVGADINIVSKELTTNSELAFDAKLGANQLAMNQSFLTADGVNSLGYAGNSQGPADETQYVFANSLDPSTRNRQLDKGYSAAGGKKFDIGENQNPLRFYLLASYDNNFEYREGQALNTTTTGVIFKDMAYDKYKQNTSHMVMGNVNYRIGNNTLSYNGLYIHTNVQYVTDYLGKNSTFSDVDDEEGFLRRQQTNDNTLIVNQLGYIGEISKRLSFDAGASLNLVVGNEPDRRMNYLSDESNGLYHLTKGTGHQQRYFSEMNESDLNLKFAIKQKLSDDADNNTAVKLGYTGRLVNRSFDAVEYDQQVVTPPSVELNTLSLDGFFNQKGLDNNEFKLDRNNDTYTVDKFVNGVFGELTFQLGAKTTGVAGLRFDNAYLNVDYLVNRGGTKGSTTIDEYFLLPSLNLKHELTEKTALRLGVSRTYALPQAKEISPFRYTGEDFLSQGNPDLKPSTSNNADLKWDYYLSADELLSVAGFFKYIEMPISRVEKASAGGYLTYDNIADFTTVEGIEVEFRKNLFKTEASKLTFGFNASYILTAIKLEDKNFTNNESQLEGASPFIVNSDLSHNIAKNNFSLTNSLVFNYFSDRIYTIGTQGYQDIIEKGIPTLDYVASCKLNKHFGISLKAKNLTNPLYQISRQPNSSNDSPIVLNSFNKGTTFSMGVSYKL